MIPIITDQELEQLESVYQATTPGPWVIGWITDFPVIPESPALCSSNRCTIDPLVHHTAHRHWHYQNPDSTPEDELWHDIHNLDPKILERGHNVIYGKGATWRYPTHHCGQSGRLCALP